ncbi:MAG TPA: hypothetical protein VGE41_04255 [Verrucomicrobiae bacterium]
MSERKKQIAFLKHLIRGEQSEHCQRFEAQILRAEKEEKCMRCAVLWVIVMGLLALAGLGYSAVFLPDFWTTRPLMLIRFLTAMTLASALCLVFYAGLWFWYRANANRLHDEIRRYVLSGEQKNSVPENILPVPNQDRHQPELRQMEELPLSKAS